MLQNDYLVAKIGVDTAENEPRKERCVVAMDPVSLLRGMITPHEHKMVAAFVQARGWGAGVDSYAN